MNILRDILFEMKLLMEAPDSTDISDAISGLHPVVIRYNDGESDAKTGERTIYPVAYGVSTAGNPVVRAYQPNGDSKRGVPNWKFFRVDRIQSWDNKPEETFNPGDLTGFNSQGDEQIETLYTIAPIGQGKQYARPQGEKPSIITPKPIDKKDIVGSDEYKEANNDRYTADNAVSDVIGHIQSKTLDNGSENDYNKGDKLNAPDTKPIEKQDIQTTPAQPTGEKTNPQSMVADNEPVTKDDIKSGEDNELTRSFNDMTNRMNNLYKEDGQNNEEEENEK